MTSPSTTPKYNRATPVTSMSAEEYAVRFRSKPTSKPAVIGLDQAVSVPPLARGTPRATPREFANQFPPANKLRLSSRDSMDRQNQIQKHFEIAPSPEMTARYYNAAGGSDVDNRRSDPNQVSARRYPFYTHTYPNLIPGPGDHPPGGDLSYLPPPKNFLARRDVPWVYRYKVKKNMNQLSRIMASTANDSKARDILT
ncbi:uncharacterized protein LOC141903451 [Tubulanus polymorphus]|uniref:uncharacterized protein LOC141903451 n=1 Tax=Tubulanus polymorphus TaxID=672921 RepID=UPI003DA27E0F